MRRARTLLLQASVISILLFVASRAHRTAQAMRQEAPADPHAWVPRPGVARILSLGENELWADLMWVRTLLYYGEGMVQQNGMPDAEKLVELVNVLDPHFRRPYQWGGYAMVFRQKLATPEEYEASVRILRRGVAMFPNDWELHWMLGFRLSLDLHRQNADELRRLREEGAALIERAMRLPGAPADLAFTALALRTKLGQRERALRELREMILTTEDPKAREKLRERYGELVSEDLSEELVRAAEADDAEWRRDAPWAPRSFYYLVGPPPPSGIDLREIARGAEFHAFDGSDSLKDATDSLKEGHTAGN